VLLKRMSECGLLAHARDGSDGRDSDRTTTARAMKRCSITALPCIPKTEPVLIQRSLTSSACFAVERYEVLQAISHFVPAQLDPLQKQLLQMLECPLLYQ